MSVNSLLAGEAMIPAEYYVRDWSMLGPFSFRNTAYAEPGDARVLAQAFRQDEPSLVPEEPGQGWQAIQRKTNWASEWLYVTREFAHDGEYLRDAWKRMECSAAYFGALIESPEAIPAATLCFAAGGYYQVWWNGAELYHYGDAGAKPHGAELDRRPIKIRSGKNYLVVKSCNFRGPWGLCAQVSGPNGEPLRIHSPQAASLEHTGLRVTITERMPIHRVVANRGAPTVFVRANGDIVVYEDMDENTRRMISTDNGRTFQRAPAIPRSGGIELADGAIYHLGNVAADDGGDFTVEVHRYDPARKTLHGPCRVPVRVPGARGWSYSDQGRPSGAGFAFHCAIRARDNRLLAATHCYWEGDTDLDEVAVGSQQLPASLGMTKPRLIMLESLDQGESWHLLSTIAHHPDLGPEGWFEPALAELPNGDLLVVIRNGSYWPLWQSRSGDGGKTWDEPEKLPMLGVHPQLKVLANGVLVLATVRPHLMLSLDHTASGRHWSHHVMVAPSNNGGLGGLIFIAEQKPNTVVCPVYEEFPVDPPVRGRTRDMHLALVKIHVERVNPPA